MIILMLCEGFVNLREKRTVLTHWYVIIVGTDEFLLGKTSLETTSFTLIHLFMDVGLVLDTWGSTVSLTTSFTDEGMSFDS